MPLFQNTLSLLSKSIIQQFLDELVWRERWGPIPSRAFDSLISHLSEMTRLDSGRLGRVEFSSEKAVVFDLFFFFHIVAQVIR